MTYDGQVSTPAYNVGPVAAINQQIYNSQIIYNPSLFPTLAANNPVAFFGEFPTINKPTRRVLPFSARQSPRRRSTIR